MTGNLIRPTRISVSARLTTVLSAIPVIALLAISITALPSCNGGPSTEQRTAMQDSAKAQDSAIAAKKAFFKTLAFDNKKDLACGMPLTAGVEDTAHYNGKLYGFCSKECKDEFLKDPAGHLAQAK